MPIRWVLIRDPLGEFDTQALLSANLALSPVEILRLVPARWQIEVTFEEVRRHLGQASCGANMLLAVYSRSHGGPVLTPKARVG